MAGLSQQQRLLLRQFLQQFPSLYPHIDALETHLVVQDFPKGTCLQQEEEPVRECFFVLKGCIRQYCLLDGREHNTAFYMEQKAATLEGYGTHAPSKRP